mgnify:CR=1 FL=1
MLTIEYDISYHSLSLGNAKARTQVTDNAVLGSVAKVSVISGPKSPLSVASRGSATPSSLASPTLKEQPQIVQLVKKEVLHAIEQSILNRSTNRHDYSMRKLIPFKVLKEISNDEFINQQQNIKTLWINNGAQIQRIARWAELVEQAIYSSKRLTMMLLSSITPKDSDAYRAIPLQSLELTLMQLTNIAKYSQEGQSEEAAKLMKTNIAMARGTSRKIIKSSGLAVVCYTGGSPSWQTLMRAGQTIMAILLKLNQHDISTHAWGNCGAMDLLHRRFEEGVKDQQLVLLRDQVSEALNNVKQLLNQAPLVIPELSENEGVLSIVRFGYALQESSQKATRHSVLKSVTLL